MREVTGDIWDCPADVILITTNGSIRKDGKAVMGRGVAKQARDKFPIVDTVLGRSLKSDGLSVCKIYEYSLGRRRQVWAFPVKYLWHLRANMGLIVDSAIQLKHLALIDSNRIFVLPKPGCGNGQLDWEDVRKLISPILPDNVHVIDLS